MINTPLLKGKGIFVYSDPGGARGVLSLIHELKNSLDEYIIISDREFSFVNDYRLSVCTYINGMENDIINTFKPDFIYTGTSYTSQIELKFIAIALKCSYNIKTYSFIDHWTNFKSRFLNNGNLVLPEFIHVIDENAKKLAIKDGLPENSLYIIGHPYHIFLKKWIPLVSYEDFITNNEIPNKKIILYAPDPITNVGGIEKYGFDELVGLELIINSLQSTKKGNEYIVLIKPHPNQNIKIFVDYLGQNTYHNIKILPVSISNNLIIFYSDYIVSFFSNIMFEANILGKKTISLLLSNMLCKLPFHELHMEINNSQELKNILDAN